MWRSLLLGKLAISISVSLLIGGYSLYRIQGSDLSSSEFYSWLAVGIFFLVLAFVQIGLGAMLFRKKKFE